MRLENYVKKTPKIKSIEKVLYGSIEIGKKFNEDVDLSVESSLKNF